ncbi:MAG TPA: hypothetical protein VK416_14880 [Thermoanaerobaculia bacterium]|nr:hypothetical protein [Thermoanaerobaculia bacterium]
MKPIVRAVPALLLVLVLFPVSLYAISVFDVIRLTQEKYSDQEIIKVIKVTDSRFVLTADDTSRLKKEGVTESVIREMLSRPAREKAAVPSAQSATKPARPSSVAAKDSQKGVPADARTQPREPASVLDEIVRMTKAGLSDETVLIYAKAHRGDLPAVMPADRLDWLRQSGVSQTVVLYLTAIDVRASNEGEIEGTTYSTEEGASYPVPAYSSPGYSDEGLYYDDGGSYAGYPDYSSYPVTDYSSYYDYPYFGAYSYPYYPYYPYYPAYFFVDTSGFFGRFHHHGHGHDGHGHGHDGGDGHGGHGGDGHGGHGGSPGDHPGGRGDGGWRGHDGNVTTGQAWRERPALARGSFTQASRQPRSAVVGRGEMGRPVMPSRGLDRVSQGTRGWAGPRVVSRPGFSGGSSRAGAMVGRAPISRPGGGPGAAGRPAFSGGGGHPGGGSVGRAPIARSGGASGGMGRSGGMGHAGGGGRGR